MLQGGNGDIVLDNTKMEHVKGKGAGGLNIISSNYPVGYGSVTLTNSVFNDCRNVPNTGSDEYVHGAGAFEILGGRVTVDNCTFTDCFAKGATDFGHVSSYVEGKISNCTFTQTITNPYYPYSDGPLSLAYNNAIYVGGSTGDGAPVTVENCTFSGITTNWSDPKPVIYSPFGGSSLTLKNITIDINHPRVFPMRLLSTTAPVYLDGVSVTTAHATSNRIQAGRTMTYPNPFTVYYKNNCTINGASGAAFGNIIDCINGATKVMY
jgi:hypothetical protein